MRVVRLFFLVTIIAFVNQSCAQTNTENQQVEQILEIPEGMQVATFAGGCFWCTEAVFERVKGVSSVVSGYAGGKEVNPTYKQVSYGNTSHAEAVQIIFDPKIVKYEELVEIFFATHDPTQLNRQGPDEGAQYRSAVYFHNGSQQLIVKKHVDKLNASEKYSQKIVTELTAFTNFYKAEEYHQDFYEINPNQSYILAVAVPKVKKFYKLFPEKIKDKYLNQQK